MRTFHHRTHVAQIMGLLLLMFFSLFPIEAFGQPPTPVPPPYEQWNPEITGASGGLTSHYFQGESKGWHAWVTDASFSRKASYNERDSFFLLLSTPRDWQRTLAWLYEYYPPVPSSGHWMFWEVPLENGTFAFGPFYPGPDQPEGIYYWKVWGFNAATQEYKFYIIPFNYKVTGQPAPYKVTVSVSGIPEGYLTNVQVDGAPSGTVSAGGSKEFSFTKGTNHTVAVDRYVNISQRVRFYVLLNNWTFSSGGEYSFTYLPQYYLQVSVDPPGIASPIGEGWYGEGAPVESAEAEPIIQGPPGARYALESWQLDGLRVQGNPVTFQMTSPHVLLARYRTQYYLTVKSVYDTPRGSDWYDANSTANFSVEPSAPVIGALGFLSYRFDHWEGDVSATTPKASVRMDSAKNVIAVWRLDFYYVSLVFLIVLCATLAALFLVLRQRYRNLKKTAHTSTHIQAPRSGSSS